MAQGVDKCAFLTGKQGVDQHKTGDWRDVVEQVDTPGYGRPAQPYREEHDQQQAPPENRHRVAGQRDAHYAVVEQRTALEGGNHACDQPEGAGEQQGGQRQFDGGGKQGEKFAPHAFPGTQRLPQVALGQQADIVEILGIQRFVQAQALHGLGMHHRVDAAFAHHHFHWVAGDHADQREGQQGDAEKGGDQQ